MSEQDFWGRVDDLMQQGLSYWDAYDTAKAEENP